MDFSKLSSESIGATANCKNLTFNQFKDRMDLGQLQKLQETGNKEHYNQDPRKSLITTFQHYVDN